MNKDFVYKKVQQVDANGKSFAKSSSANKSGKLVDNATDEIGDGTKNAAKKGTGGVNKWGKISSMADSEKGFGFKDAGK